MYIYTKECKKMMDMVDDNLEFYENGEQWTKENMSKFCPLLPEKRVFKTFNKQHLLTKSLGYDFVSQYYVNQNQDTLCETTSRIWEKSSYGWKIIKMNVVRDKISDL